MPINFIPNDPLAQNALPMRPQAARPNRPSGRAGFAMSGAVPKQLEYQPGTLEFMYWQCREAALAAVEVWETVDGPLKQWSPKAIDPKRLPLHPDDGDDLNAYYDRASLSFFEHTTGPKTTFSGASTDVVAHECGHALLDAIKPELWGVPTVEAGAFHEAFGDCIALLTALADGPSRGALLNAAPKLDMTNFVEATAEDLSDGVRRDPRFGPNHPAAAPRHALNDFRWQLPTTLPKSGGPQVLTAEVHSSGRIFSGYFYDTIRNIFSASSGTEAALWSAAQTAAKLLLAAARNAPITALFFQSVGHAMILADDVLNSGVNRQAIADAFERHGIALGSATMLAPTVSLAGGAPEVKAGRASLPAATRKDLMKRLGAGPRARMSVSPVEIAGSVVTHGVHYREVSLQPVSRRLQGVVALVPESVLLGAAGPRAAVLGALPEATATADEVQAFAAMLLENDDIAFEGPRRSFAARAEPKTKLPTHAVRMLGGKKVLTRLRFAAPPGRRSGLLRIDPERWAGVQRPSRIAVCR